MNHPTSLQEIVENGLCLGCGLCQSVAGPDNTTVDVPIKVRCTPEVLFITDNGDVRADLLVGGRLGYLSTTSTDTSTTQTVEFLDVGAEHLAAQLPRVRVRVLLRRRDVRLLQ